MITRSGSRLLDPPGVYADSTARLRAVGSELGGAAEMGREEVRRDIREGKVGVESREGTG
jgi:hypothetical protein